MSLQEQSTASVEPERKTAVVQQVGGSHYGRCVGACPHCGEEIQHWDLYGRMPYLEGMATKYITRWREKGGIEDLRKAITAIEKIIAVETLLQTQKEPNGQ